MYEAFYGLKERPFNLTPDPRFLFLSEKHKEAFAHLLFGIKNRSGFVMVTGEIGTGKTTICRTLLGQLDDDTEVAFIFNPCLSPDELLRKINEDFGIDSRAETMKGLIDELNAHLLERGARGKNCVLVIDEAQNLSPPVLEQVRLLSNLETETAKLIQIVLIGQPELGQSLELPELRQLNQRITARYHLKPLDAEETLQYIVYRLRVAGGRRKIRFSRGAINAVYKFSKGTPRVINAVCDRALLIGYTQETGDITTRMVRRAAREIRGERLGRPRKQAAWRGYLPNPTAMSVTAILCVTAVYLFGPWGYDRAIAPASLSTPSTGQVGKPAPPEAPRTPPPLHAVSASVQDPSRPEGQAAAFAERPVTEFARTLNALDPAVARNAAALAVLRAWNMALLSGYPEGDALDQLAAFAAANGLAFESLPLTVDQVKAIRLPAFIKVAGDKTSLWLAWIGQEEEKARVTTGVGETLLVPDVELAARYANQTVLMWRDSAPGAPILKEGANGVAVREFQEKLRRAGRLPSFPSGVYDANTVAAVRAIQEETGLTVDGIAGRQTRMVLAGWLSTPGHVPAAQSLLPLPAPSPAHAVAEPVEDLSEPAVADAPPDATSPKPDESSAPLPALAAPVPPEAPSPPAGRDEARPSIPVVPAWETAPSPPPITQPAGMPALPVGKVKVEELAPPDGGASLPPAAANDAAKEVTPPAVSGSPLVPREPSPPDPPEGQSG